MVKNCISFSIKQKEDKDFTISFENTATDIWNNRAVTENLVVPAKGFLVIKENS